MKRRYIVNAYKGDSRQPAFSVSYDSAEDALNSFAAALAGAGHDERTVALRIKTLAAVAMGGGRAATFMDPDLGGWVSITITE